MAQNSLVFEFVDLKKNLSKSFWNKLKKATVSGWAAQNEFEKCQNNPEQFEYFKVLLAKNLTGNIVAWGAVVKNDWWKDVWAWTSPSKRKTGIQKELLPQLRQKVEKEIKVSDLAYWDQGFRYKVFSKFFTKKN